MKIAFVNTGRYTSSRGRTSFSDPVHLVGMHNLCLDAGLESRIFQLGYPDEQRSIAALLAYAPEVLALSFLAPFKSDMDVTNDLLRAFRGKGIRLILGGPDVTLDRTFYEGKFAAASAQDWRAVTLVQGPGETYVQALAPHAFDLTDARAQNTLIEAGALVSFDDGLGLVSGLKELPLDAQGFRRDYDLTPFNHKATVKWSTGCWAACKFCPNIPSRSDYKSPELVAKEVEHLLEMGAQKLDIASPQFTANPDRVAALVASLPPNTPSAFFSSRIDGLYHSVMRHEASWLQFGHANDHGIGLGVDSFLPERLLRMRKYYKMAEAQQQRERLNVVLDFFAQTRVNIVFYLITLDHEMRLEEVRHELQEALYYMNTYPNTVQIAPETITNVLAPSSGSHYSETMKPMDFFYFKEDPRLLLLLYSQYHMLDILEDLINQSDEAQELLEAAAARVLARFGLQAIETLETISREHVDLEATFSVLKDTLSDIFYKEALPYSAKEIVERMVLELPKKPQKTMRKFLTKSEKKMKKLLAKEFDELLTRKALHRMRLEGKLDDKQLTNMLRKYR